MFISWTTLMGIYLLLGMLFVLLGFQTPGVKDHVLKSSEMMTDGQRNGVIMLTVIIVSVFWLPIFIYRAFSKDEE